MAGYAGGSAEGSLGPPKASLYKTTDGILFSSLFRSVTDLRPRKMDVEQCTLLCNLAELVSRGLENNSKFIQETLNNSQSAAEPTAQIATSSAPAALDG